MCDFFPFDTDTVTDTDTEPNSVSVVFAIQQQSRGSGIVIGNSGNANKMSRCDQCHSNGPRFGIGIGHGIGIERKKVAHRVA